MSFRVVFVLYASRMEVHLDMTLDELIAALARFFFPCFHCQSCTFFWGSRVSHQETGKHAKVAKKAGPEEGWNEGLDSRLLIFSGGEGFAAS